MGDVRAQYFIGILKAYRFMEKTPLVLGIETSCDETALSLIQNKKVLISLVSSQIKDHAKFGGVIPEIAARKHLEVIPRLFDQLIEEAKIKPKDIDLISVTQGPGLVGALLVGSSFAKGLALSLEKPILPVNHVHAHVHGALLGLDESVKDSELFPALSLVVSGGHTNLFYMKSSVDFELLAQSIDDACGECFDKVAKMLGLSYPGGPILEQMALGGDSAKFKMPKMMAKQKQLDFSYSGLKTHVYYLIKSMTDITDQDVADICASFQDNAFEQIIRRLKQVYASRSDLNSILIAGGVAANKRFRALISSEINLPIFFPDLAYCSDNAAMVAAYGEALYKNPKTREAHLSLNYDFDVYSRYHQFKAK